MATLVLRSGTTLPPAQVGVPYDVTLAFTAQTVATAIVLSNGAGVGNGLPAGLSFDASAARISGTPKQFTASVPTSTGVALKGPGQYSLSLNAGNGTDTVAGLTVTLPVIANGRIYGELDTPYPYTVAAELAQLWPQS